MEEVKKLTATQLKMYAKRLDAIRADLQSENTTTILRALEKLKEYGYKPLKDKKALLPKNRKKPHGMIRIAGYADL
jgi:hypothetical protein